jgi:hypothetical protein
MSLHFSLFYIKDFKRLGLSQNFEQLTQFLPDDSEALIEDILISFIQRESILAVSRTYYRILKETSKRR